MKTTLINKEFVLAMALFVSLASQVRASFDDFLTGGRATGMDGAVTAISDDIFGLYYNPATLRNVKSFQAGTYYGQLYRGLSENDSLSRSFTAGVYSPSEKAWSLGVGYQTLALSDLYKEQVASIGYARDITPTFDVGGTVKYLRKDIGTDFFTQNGSDPQSGIFSGTQDPFFNGGRSKTAYGLDLGLLWTPRPTYRVGLAISNINEPNVAINGPADKVGRVTRAGFAKTWKNQLVSFDLTEEDGSSQEVRQHLGYEIWLKDRLGLRAGGGIGNHEYERLTAGLSYRFSMFQLDYGFMMPIGTLQESSGTHQVSFIARFASEKQQTSH